MSLFSQFEEQWEKLSWFQKVHFTISIVFEANRNTILLCASGILAFLSISFSILGAIK